MTRILAREGEVAFKDLIRVPVTVAAAMTAGNTATCEIVGLHPRMSRKSRLILPGPFLLATQVVC